MAKYVEVVSGKMVQKTPISTSSGVPDASKIPQTDSSGLLDKSLLTPETYVHNQLVAATTWNITHNLRKKPSVTVLDSSDRNIEVDVMYVDENNVTLSLGVALSGKALLN